MGREIERKFLVEDKTWVATESTKIIQGYLNSDKNRIVRIRITDSTAYLTVKGLTEGFTRKEFEYEIPIEDAKEMIDLCESPILEKKRSIVFHDGRKWEVDEFFGKNEGLITAEIELDSKDDKVSLPEWVGEEVSNDKRYFNSNLLKNPYKNW